MTRFRKRPLEIEAIQFTGDNAFNIWHFMGRQDLVENLELQRTDHPIIETLEGNMTLTPGNWLIRGVQGEFYPCREDVFEQTYEPVETPKRSRDMRITSAALRRPSDGLIASLPAPARHGEIQLHTMHKYTPEEFRKHPWEYGFLLQDGTFVDRKQAASIARRAKQLIRPLDPGGELTTDHVW